MSTPLKMMFVSGALALLAFGCSEGAGGGAVFGEPCAAPGDCETGLCVPRAGGGGYCTAECTSSCAAPGYTCTPAMVSGRSPGVLNHCWVPWNSGARPITGRSDAALASL